jgi:membrane associated rhomboid family serine protease
MTEDLETVLRVARNDTLAREWELVLLSQGLSPRIHQTLDGFVLTVPRHEMDRALAGLAAYENEDLSKVPRRDVSVAWVDLLTGAALGLLLLAFFAVTAVSNPDRPWLERGSANAGRIFDGELWRAVTALTLHADVTHAVSNAFGIAIFFAPVSAQLGIGVAAAVVFSAGACGNLANSFLQGSPHDSAGASTAVFGAVGILGSLAMIRRGRAAGDKRRAWIAMAAALALLGMLGAGGGRVDVLAHLLGFLAGGALGIVIALVAPLPLGPNFQWICGGATFGVILYCWALALGW